MNPSRKEAARQCYVYVCCMYPVLPCVLQGGRKLGVRYILTSAFAFNQLICLILTSCTMMQPRTSCKHKKVVFNLVNLVISHNVLLSFCCGVSSFWEAIFPVLCIPSHSWTTVCWKGIHQLYYQGYIWRLTGKCVHVYILWYCSLLYLLCV